MIDFERAGGTLLSGVLLFGGSFNPIHHGHLIVARAAAETLRLPRVSLIPAAAPPHKSPDGIAPADDRIEMCRLAVQGDDLFEVSDWELRRPGPSYTLHTVQHFAGVLGPATPLYWLIGMDSLAELPTWHRIGELAELCTFVTARRPTDLPPLDALFDTLAKVISPTRIRAIREHMVDTPLIDISATDIRRRCRDKMSIRYLTGSSVADYINSHELYRSH